MNKKLASEKYLVVEQKGWRVVALGLTIAALFSLTFNAVFRPRRIKYEIERALSASDPRIKSSLTGAYLSLSDGVWPRLAIVIDQLELESADPCLFRAKATIENLVLPVAFSTLLDRTLVFKRIEVGSLNLDMMARREGCGNPALTALPTIPQTIAPPADLDGDGPVNGTIKSPVDASVDTKDQLDRPPLVQTISVESNLLRNIKFHAVNLRFIEWPVFHWNLKDVNVHLPESSNDKTHIGGLVTLSADSNRYPFQGVRARLEMEASPELATAKIHGAWREGRVELEGQWKPHQKDFHVTGNFNEVPWSQLIVLAHALGKAEPMPASSQAWVSAQLDWVHSSTEPESLEVDEAKIEGEFGKFVLGKLIAQKKETGDDWDVKPYKVLANKVDLDILTKMIGWQDPPPEFDRLGVFDGEAQFVNNQLISMMGGWSNLQIIFSNRGQREIQIVDNMQLELAGSSNRWTGYIKKINLQEGQWQGDVNLTLDQNSKEVELASQFSQFKLNPEVEDLMTVHGKLSPLEGRVTMKFTDGKITDLNGTVRMDSGVLNEIAIEKIKADFEGTVGRLNGKVQVQSMNFPRSQLQYWPQQIPEFANSMVVKSLTGRFVRTPSTLDISDVQGHLTDSKSRFVFDAGWTNTEDLHGVLQILGDRKKQNFNLSGTRKAPQWN